MSEMSAEDVIDGEGMVYRYHLKVHGRAEPLGGRVLDALYDAGFAVVRLPEPTGQWAEGSEWVQGGWTGDQSGWITWTAHEAHVMLQRVEPGELSPDEARALAAALLAAADYAEAPDA